MSWPSLRLKQIYHVFAGMACALLLVLSTGPMCLAQSQVLDVDALSKPFVSGSVRFESEEFIYQLYGGAMPDTLHAAAMGDPGKTRELPTAGISVSRYYTESYQGRTIVSDFANQGVYSIDIVGTEPPIPLSPEPGDDFIASIPNGLVALPIDGDSLSDDPAQRDRLYTRSLLGGPAIEITGGLGQFRELSGVSFSEAGNAMVVGTYGRFETGSPTRTSKVFFAKPGETGMTPVLDSFHNGMRFRPMGSDTASEHFLFFTFNSNSSLPGGELWSVPIDNPAAAVQLSVREDETQIGFDNEVLDAEESRVLFTSRELVDNPCCQPSMYTIWSAPLDGSTLPTVLGKLPRGRNPGTIRPVAESPWVYVFGADDFSGDNPSYYAIHSNTGEMVEFSDPNSLGVEQFTISADGSTVLFSDTRTGGNDLYVGSPNDAGKHQELLLDIPDTDRLVRVLFSHDEQYAIAALAAASEPNDALADRLIAVSLSGGDPIMLDDGTAGPVPAIFSNAGYAPTVVGDRLFYLKGYNNQQSGFYAAALPTPSTSNGDFDGDGDVDGADFLVWQRGDSTSPRSAEDLAAWQSNYGASASTAGDVVAARIPEPTTLTFTGLVAPALLLFRRPS